MTLIPGLVPQAKREDVERVINIHALNPRVLMDDKVFAVSIRGYYLNTMGKKGVNDRGMYDDAVFIVSPTCFTSFNFNVDPSAYRNGIANLKEGVYRYQVGIHGYSKPANRRYQAYVQDSEVTVKRDNGITESGYFGINIHKGGEYGTSSLGCQTVPPAQWKAFNELLKHELSTHGKKTFPYILNEGME